MKTLETVCILLFLHSKSLNKEVDFFATFIEPKINKKKIKDFIEISSFSRDGETKLEQQNYKSDFLSCDDGKSYLNWLLFPYTHIPSPDGGNLILCRKLCSSFFN